MKKKNLARNPRHEQQLTAPPLSTQPHQAPPQEKPSLDSQIKETTTHMLLQNIEKAERLYINIYIYLLQKKFPSHPIQFIETPRSHPRPSKLAESTL